MQVPQYEIPKVAPTTQAAEAKVPVGFASMGPEAALAQTGESLSTLGRQWQQKIQAAEQAEEFSRSLADASVQLHDLQSKITSSPEFILDPEGGRKLWDQKSREIGMNISHVVKDEKARQHFENQFQGLLASHTNAITDTARRATVDKIKAGGLDSIQKLSNAAIASPTDDIYHKNMAGALATLDGMLASGAVNWEQYQKSRTALVDSTLKAKASNVLLTNPTGVLEALDDPRSIYASMSEPAKKEIRTHATHRSAVLASEQRAEEDRLKKQVQSDNLNRAYQEYTTIYGDNPADAVPFARDPKNYPDLDPEHRERLVNMLEGSARWKQHLADETQKQNDNTVFDNYLKSVSGGAMPTENQIVGTPASAKVKEELIRISRQRNEDRYKTKPEVMSDVLSKVWSGSISSRTQLLPYIGNGVSLSDVKEIAGSLEQASDPTKSKYFQMADDLFTQKYEDDSDMMKMKTEYLILLDQHIKRDGLKGPDIFKRAEELMKPLSERRWWKFTNSLNRLDTVSTWGTFSIPAKALWSALSEDERPAFVREIEDNPPWLTIESLHQESSPQPIAPSAVRSPVPRINPAIQERIKDLRGKGYTDEQMANFLREKNVDPIPYGLK